MGKPGQAAAPRVAAGLRLHDHVHEPRARRACGKDGFHLLWLELEHSPVTLETVRHVVLATRGLPAVPFARVPLTETWLAKRVLDAGVHGVIFPFVSTPELARTAADACRYPPIGHRGSGASLATTTWPEPDAYLDSLIATSSPSSSSRKSRRWRTSTRLPPLRVWMSCLSAPFRSACAASSITRRRGGGDCARCRGGTARQQDVRLDRSK